MPSVSSHYSISAILSHLTVLSMVYQGSNPKMISNLNCRYEIEWVTEYACHRDYLESHNCTLTSEQHDISIDLTHLTHTRELTLLV